MTKPVCHMGVAVGSTKALGAGHDTAETAAPFRPWVSSAKHSAENLYVENNTHTHLHDHKETHFMET